MIGVGAYGIRTAPDNTYDIEISLSDLNDNGEVIEQRTSVRKFIKSAESPDQVIPILFTSPIQLCPGRYELRYMAKVRPGKSKLESTIRNIFLIFIKIFKGPETYYNANAGALCKSLDITPGKEVEPIRFVFDGPMSNINIKHHIPEIYFAL